MRHGRQVVTRVLILALAAFYLTRLLRKLSPWLAARKPVGCNECMSAWAPLGISLVDGVRRLDFRPLPWLTIVAASGVCLLLLEVAETLRPPPIDLGNLP